MRHFFIFGISWNFTIQTELFRSELLQASRSLEDKRSPVSKLVAIFVEYLDETKTVSPRAEDTPAGLMTNAVVRNMEHTIRARISTLLLITKTAWSKYLLTGRPFGYGG